MPGAMGRMPGAPAKSLLGVMTVPRPLTSILLSIAGLAVFLVIASRLLVYYPISSTIFGQIITADALGNFSERTIHTNISMVAFDKTEHRQSGKQNGAASFLSPPIAAGPKPFGNTTLQNGAEGQSYPGFSKKSSSAGSEAVDAYNSSYLAPNPSKDFSVGSERNDTGSCNLYRGKWVHDPSGLLYTNNSCPIITQMQNCQGNGRPDRDYENWRWKPDECVLPRFDPKKFLELMRGKTLAFVGDSVIRNQMESMLCILWQVEAPSNHGSRRMQRWFFNSTSTNIIRIWSSWLVHQTSEPDEFAPKGVVKLHLDESDENFMQYLPTFDVLVLASGHWFAKQSAYIFRNKVVGGQLWWPDKNRKMETNNVEAFGISVETILSAIVSHPNYTGLTIVRSFSPDHYEGGAWNTGGSCTGKTRPAEEFPRNGFTDAMHEKQVKGFQEAVKKAKKNGSKLKLMDITDIFGYRHDGHPGPYRNPDPNKKTKRGPNGRPPPQDCLHWCMPGPVDTWNEFVMEIIRREFEGV